MPARPVLGAVASDDRAPAVLRTAGELAEVLRAELRVLHVEASQPAAAVPAPGVPFAGAGLAALGAPALPPTTTAATTPTDGGALLRELEVPEDAALVRAGDPAGVVVETARELGASFVVVGTGGRGALSAAVSGSVSRAVVHAVPGPVVVVPPETAGGVRRGLVLCAVSPREDEAEAAVGLAARLARRCSGRLVLAHAAELPGATAPEFAAFGPSSAGAAKRRGLERLREVAGLVPPDLEVALEPRLGDPAAAMADAARACGAALLVTASRGHGLLGEALLGSVSRRLACEAPCPVVIARPGDGPAGTA